MAAVLGVAGFILTGCGSTPMAKVTPPPHPSHIPRPALSDAFVCAAFNRTVSPTLHHYSYAAFARLAEQAQDVGIRTDAEALIRDDRSNPNVIVPGSKYFYDIGSECVAKGLTPKYWADLA